MNHRALLLSAVLLVGMIGTLAAQTRITKTDGTVFEGRVQRDSGGVVELVSNDSTLVRIPREAIRTMEFGVTPNTYPGGYALLGITALTPAGINLVGGYYGSTFGVRACAGYLGAIGGLQGNFVFNVVRSRRYTGNITVMFGYMSLTTTSHYVSTFGPYGARYDSDLTRTWSYFGAGYEFNWGGFFLEPALSIGSGSFSNPQLLLQIGYVHEFR